MVVLPRTQSHGVSGLITNDWKATNFTVTFVFAPGGALHLLPSESRKFKAEIP